ncbi:hypothetical protein ACFL1X_05375 [Candidatus Hydrogenedentota bacterium]
MQTFKLWLEPDKDISQFQRLMYEKVEVPVVDVIQKGIHPWQERKENYTLAEKFAELFNGNDMEPAEMVQFNYCYDVTPTGYTYCSSRKSRFEDLLENIKRYVYFTGNISFAELLAIAKERLQKQWSHRLARTLLGRICTSFDAQRTFLKSKDSTIKLSGRADIDYYDLGSILSLDDFASDDRVLVDVGIPTTNFRSVDFMKHVTDERGLLQLRPNISEFKIKWAYGQGYIGEKFEYNCQVKDGAVHFRPELDKSPEKRRQARKFSEQWRTVEGRYCFATSLAKLEEMLVTNKVRIRFPGLDYKGKDHEQTSSACILPSGVSSYSVGRYLTANASGDAIKRALRNHEVSMTGRKTKLLEKLSGLAVTLYEKYEPEMTKFFRKHMFVRIATGRDKGKGFPILEDLDMREMILAMYTIKHLRGNAILDARHENDTFDLASLANSLINGEVAPKGAFLAVE